MCVVALLVCALLWRKDARRTQHALDVHARGGSRQPPLQSTRLVTTTNTQLDLSLTRRRPRRRRARPSKRLYTHSPLLFFCSSERVLSRLHASSGDRGAALARAPLHRRVPSSGSWRSLGRRQQANESSDAGQRLVVGAAAAALAGHSRVPAHFFRSVAWVASLSRALADAERGCGGGGRGTHFCPRPRLAAHRPPRIHAHTPNAQST